jgi:hypothetical protein
LPVQSEEGATPTGALGKIKEEEEEDEENQHYVMERS